MMEKYITISGVGKVNVVPDQIVLELRLSIRRLEYVKTMRVAADAIDSMRRALVKLDFPENALKTTDFQITAEYRTVKDCRGDCHEVFEAWLCSHSLKLEFPFDLELLSKVLLALGKTDEPPKLQVSFTVADETKVSAELLRSATANARSKAEILCEAGGAELGELLRINYNWDELELFSATRYEDGDLARRVCCKSQPMYLDPEEIKVCDSAVFIWAIR